MMHRIWFRLLWLPILCLALRLPAAELIYRASDIRRITAMASRVIYYNHYSGCRDKELISRRTFDLFFDGLDSRRMFFTAGEIREFAKEKETIFPEALKGNYQFALRVYHLYLRRIREYGTYVKQLTSAPMDFTVDEYWEYNRKKAQSPWPADEAALRDLWRRYIKYRLLDYKLDDLLEDDGPADKDKEKKTAKKRTPEERLQAAARDLVNMAMQQTELDLAGELLNAICSAFGAHNSYDTPVQSDSDDIHMSLQLSGIGAKLVSDGGCVKVVELIPGGPAEKSGKIKVNDRILGVTQQDGTFVDLVDVNVSKAAPFIRGPKKTKVTLHMRSEFGGNYRVTLVREEIDLKSAAASGRVVTAAPGGIKPVKVGILRLPSFYRNMKNSDQPDGRSAERDVWKILQDFQKQQVEAIVLDLRYNGGGYAYTCEIIASLFLDRGRPLVQMQVGSPNGIAQIIQSGNAVFDKKDYTRAFQAPLVVLVNKLSASASEELTGALRDNRRAIVVGDTRSYGKGTSLLVHDLDEVNWLPAAKQRGGSVTFEAAMFFRPGGPSVQELGIASDIVLPSLTEVMEYGEKFEANHLPARKVAPAEIPPVTDRNPETLIPLLRRHSAARIAASAEYQALIKLAEILKQKLERKRTTLNLEKRLEEMKKSREYSKKINELIGETETMTTDLQEAVNIAAELYSLQ